MAVGLLTTSVIIACAVGHAIGADPLAFDYGQLVFSTLLYRHGDRSIQRTYSTDPYANKSYWPMGFGELTPAGIKRQVQLGKWLRERYVGWLPEVYSNEDVYVRSTDYDRTIMSAQANLAGLYPSVGPKKDVNEVTGVNNQIIPIHTVPRSYDYVLLMKSYCPRYIEEFDKVQNSRQVQKFYAKFKSVFEYIKNKTGVEFNKSLALDIYDSLAVKKQFNYPIPLWTKSIFPQPLKTIVEGSLELTTHTTIMKRLKAGPLLNEIVNNMENKKNGALSPDRLLWMYSAHDSTMINLLNTMGIYENTLVPYATILMIELRLNATGNYVVTVSYRNSSNHNPYLLQVPGCENVACELEKFTDLLRPVIPVNWDIECQSKEGNYILEALIYSISIVVVTAIIVLITYKITHRILFRLLQTTDCRTH